MRVLSLRLGLKRSICFGENPKKDIITKSDYLKLIISFASKDYKA